MPVVTTSKGAEGLDVVDGEHLLFADTPRDFAAETLRLLGDAAFARELGARGRALVAERYTWERQGARLRDIVRGLLAERGTA
jgi:glycosyltransferase involved in cell wall biosynthesis